MVDNTSEINLKELLIKEEHPWIGIQIKELDISRQESLRYYSYRLFSNSIRLEKNSASSLL